MLTYNTFRNSRYFRTRFSDGRYLLSSEASDLELEMLDQIRQDIKKAFGNISIGDAWKVLVTSQTTISINPGTSFYQGLPYTMRDGRDQLVTRIGDITHPALPTGVAFSASDTAQVGTFTLGSTPSGQYTIVVTATEQTIDSTSDPFLQNVDVPEMTATKRRLLYGLNVVPTSQQSSNPVPYVGDGYFGSSSGLNLTNQISVTCPAGAIINNLSGTGKNIDGRSYEIVLSNTSGAIPSTGSPDALGFTNGKLIDTSGQQYWLNGIVLGTDPITLRVDAEVNQPAPIFTATLPFILRKADVYSTTDSGASQGKLFFPIATVEWNITSGFVHTSVVTDLRTSVLEEDQFETLSNEKFTLDTVNGGTFTLGVDAATLSWASDVNIIGPSVQTQTINAGSSYLVDGGFLIYELDLSMAVAIQKDNLSVTTTTTGTSISLSGSPDLSNVSVGNIIFVGTSYANILSIDNINKTLTVSSSLATSGSGTIYQDSYAGNTYLTGPNTYVFAGRTGSVVWIADKLALSAGQSAKLGVPSPAGIIKITAYDPIDTSLPSGTNATIDGYSVVNGDTVLFSNLSSGNNEAYQVSGVGTSLVWTATGVFAGQTTPTIGDLVIFTQGTEFQNQIAEFNGSTFVINNPVRYFNGVDFWEQSSIQTSTLNDNSSGTIFSVTALGSENMVINFSLNRGGIKETGTLWLTNDGSANSYISTGGAFSGDTGVTFSTLISGANVLLNYTTTNTGSSVTMKYIVSRWSDNVGGPTGLPSYSPSVATIYAAAFVMSDNSGTPLNCNPTFNVLGKTRVQLNFSYITNRNSGTTVGDLDIYVNGQRMPRYVSGVTLDGYYNEISTNTVEFYTDLTSSPVSIELIKKV